MTSISSSSSTPLPFVQTALQRDVAAGSISSTDATALTSAIDSIASQLQTGVTGSTGATTSTTTAAPTSMKDRVDGMIDAQVSSGALTSDQGSELKGVFAQAHAHMHGAHGHHGGGGGGSSALDGLLASLTGQTSSDGTVIDPVTGLPTTSATGSATTTASTTASTDPLQASATNAVAALEAFLTQFKAAIGSNGVYNANGQSSSSPTSILINSIG